MRKKLPDGIQEVKFKGGRYSKFKGKAIASHKTKDYRKLESDRDQEWEKLWNEAPDITAELNTVFSVQFASEVYLGRREETICAAVRMNENDAFLIFREDWLKTNEVDYEKEYQCKRTSKTIDGFYRKIPIYTVVVTEEEKEVEKDLTKKEEAIPVETAALSTILKPEHITEVIITNLKTEITFSTIPDSDKALSFIRRIPQEEGVSDKEERETEELRKELCLWEVTWIAANNTLLYLYGKRKEEEEYKKYRANMENFLKRIDFEKAITSNDAVKKEKGGNAPKVEVAKTTIKKKRKYNPRQKIIIPNTDSREEPGADENLLMEILRPQTEEKEISPETNTAPPVKKKRGRPRKQK